MNLRIDFLKKSERRYQGIVSTKVMVLSSIGVLLGTSLIVVSMAMITKASQAASYRRTNQEWERLSPLAAAARQNEAAMNKNQKTLDRIHAWGKGGSAPTYAILREVQQEIPDQMELRNLQAGILEDGADEPPVYILRLSGRIFGEMVAVDTKRKLTENEVIHDFCGNIRLVSSGRESGDIWTFVLEGRRAQEETPQ
ncbi:MAG TPA: hypothetical protein VJ904_01915 [Tichowtungia sp.]|nr:hypothetical protein [Tichowtungia sp.]